MKKAYLADYKLVRKALNGDRYAFGEIVKKNEQLVAKTIIGMLGNTQEAEDVGQEVFIRFYKSMDNYKGDSALSTYLTRIAINLSLNEIKKLQKNQNVNIENYNYKISADDEVEKKEITDTVTTALQQLEPEFRSVVILRMIQGYSSKETAQILNLPVGTVLSRLSRAHQKLKSILNKELNL